MLEQVLMDIQKADPEWNVVLLRYFNPIGAHESGLIGENPNGIPNNLMPYITQTAIGMREELGVFGDDYDTRDGTCIRDYVNVEDLADAHILALKYLVNGGGTDFFNLGTNEGSSVKEVFAECEKVTGKKIPLKIKGRRPGDPAVLVADNRKAKEILHWNPRRTLSDSIRTAYMWEKKMRGN